MPNLNHLILISKLYCHSVRVNTMLKDVLSLNNLILISKMYYHSVRVNTMLKDVLEFESFNPDLQNVLPQCPCQYYA